MSKKLQFYMKQQSEKHLPFIPFVIPLVIFLGSILFLYLLPFSKVIDSTIVPLSVLDYLLTMSIVALFFTINKREIVQTDLLLKTDYLLFTKKYFYFFVPLVLYSLYGTYNNLSLVIFGGYNREGLLDTVFRWLFRYVIT